MKSNPLRSRCAPSSDLVVRRGFFAAVIFALALPLHGVAAQSVVGSLGRGSIVSPILTIDSERLFLESAFGQRVVAQIEAQSAELAAENRQIEADLEAEERELTEVRATMEAEAFREMADVFDEKVQETRLEQAAKSRALNAQLDQEREVFLSAAAPVLEQLMRAADAAVILERRSVFVSASAIEITDDAIALLDETLGDGTP